MTVDRDREYCQMNLYKKVPGKTVSEKKPGNKNFGKKNSNFLKSLEKKCNWNKVLCFGFLGLFFLK